MTPTFPDMTLTRREMLKRSAAAAGGTVVATTLGGVFVSAGPAGALPLGGYGPLVADPAGVLDLPEGFSYRILSRGGDGYPTGFSTYTGTAERVAGDNDAMGSFLERSSGNTLVVRNQELSASGGDLLERVPTTYQGQPVATYDPAAGGGTTNLVLDRDGNLLREYPSLAGTFNNCAGGVTPWGTWLTCEETSNFVPNDASGVRHGYVFEVDPRGVSTNAVPYRAMGRFPHEACAVDPRNSDVYETEDAGITGLLYKFVPTDKSKRFGSLASGGSLFAMLVPGFTRFEQITTPGTVISGITWTPSPVDPDVGFGVNLRDLFPNTEVTRGQKLEGAWFADGVLWFVLSRFDVAPAAGQPDLRNNGQVFRYDPVKNQLELHVYLPVGGVFDQPDNIVVTPFGGAFLCEDGGGDQYVVGVDGQGATFPFAKNRLSGNSEFAGACFSPDARFMFVNIQNPSTTFAITGPWALNADLPPVVPEVPKAVMLPLAGVGALAAGVLALRRRGEGGSAQA